MAQIDHYMVEHLDAGGDVVFDNATELSGLTEALTLAAKVSKTVDTGAYVVAFEAGDKPGTFTACGHISFFDGKRGDTDGVVL